MPPVMIMRVTPETVSSLERIAVDVFDYEPAADWLVAYMATPNHAMVVAVADGVVVGQARGMVHLQPDAPPQLYIDNLGVTPAWKRQGVATRLVQALIDWGRGTGCDSSWVATESDNDEARGFYAAFGFAGETMAYYVRDERA